MTLENLQHKEHLLLRAPEPTDVTQLTVFENEEEFRHLGVATSFYSRHQILTYIQASQNDLFVDGSLRWVIEDSKNGQIVGTVDLIDYHLRHNRAEIGIALLPAYRGRGIARWAVESLETYAFSFLGIETLYAQVLEDNVEAICLFRTCGYAQVGVLKHWFRIGKTYKDIVVFQKINS